MPLHEQLLGQWSAYTYAGYGSMEDEQIIFLADQTGWYAFDRGFLCERQTFTWSLSPAGALSLAGRTYGVIGAQRGTWEARPSTLHITGLTISIREEQVQWPDAALMRVLTFAYAPFAGSVKFARIATNSDEIAFPRFIGEEPVIKSTDYPDYKD